MRNLHTEKKIHPRLSFNAQSESRENIPGRLNSGLNRGKLIKEKIAEIDGESRRYWRKRKQTSKFRESPDGKGYTEGIRPNNKSESRE